MIIAHTHNEHEFFFLVEEADEGGYIARALHHPIFTQADTLEELMEMIRDAVICHRDEYPLC
jgi:predicted RNase H-like HicB family nuclease